MADQTFFVLRYDDYRALLAAAASPDQSLSVSRSSPRWIPVDALDIAEPIDRIEAEIGSWGQQTFPNATLDSIFAHLTSEIAELGDVVNGRTTETREELADCAILLMQLAYRSGFSLRMAIEEKMEKNRSRSWGYDPDPGFSRHTDD